MLRVGTAKPLQGLFLLLRAFESITDTNVQRSILQHSLQLKDLSEGSRVQLLRHEIQSANELMKVLRCCSPKTTKDDHIMMLQGPSLDIVSSLTLPSLMSTCVHGNVFATLVPVSIL